MRLPGGRSLWSATAPFVQAFPAQHGETRAEVVVVGGGITGLSAALRLSEAGRDVLVLESAQIGAGASGLNGGQVIPGIKHDPDAIEAQFGTRVGAQIIDTVARGPDLVFELIHKHEIACDPVRAGWLQLATSTRALERVAARVHQWKSRGAAVELLDRASTARLTGSERYHGAMLDRRAGTVQPLAYVRGLAAAAYRAGARLHADSAAIRLETSGGGWTVHTRAGAIACRQVIIATNAYSGELVGSLRRTIVPVPSMQVATAVLAPHLRRTILAEGQAASDTWRLLRYFRLSREGRLVMGSRGLFGDVPIRRAASPHYRAIAEIYPQLEDVAFDYHWSGFVAMTADHWPHLHEIAPGLCAGLGYNGRGVAMATVMGSLLARRALGEDPAQLGFPVTALRPLRLHRFSRWGASVAIQCLRALDGVSRGLQRFSR